MEKELNISAILKDKPEGMKLWSPIFGDCTLDKITSADPLISEQSLICVYTPEKVLETFYSNGKYDKRGECVIFPSKQMQDWNKFAWKEGDILVSNDNDCHIIFEDFSKDDYTTFEGKHWTGVSVKRYIAHLDAQNIQDYHIENNKDAAQTYINAIEKQLGGKLNLETLEIEKQPEFKDGDILYSDETEYSDATIFIAKISDGVIGTYAYIDLLDESVMVRNDTFEESEINAIRLATDSEKQQLFDALAKEGRRWNPDTKQIEDLFKNYEFKPFDKVLVRDYLEDKWMPNFFSCYDGTSEYKYGCIAGSSDNVVFSKYCIPYNNETKYLLGTTGEWKG